MNNQNNVSPAMVTSILTLIVGGVVVFMGLQKVDTYLRMKGMDDCAKISRFETNGTDGSHVWYPIADMYKECLKDKGIER